MSIPSLLDVLAERLLGDGEPLSPAQLRLKRRFRESLLRGTTSNPMFSTLYEQNLEPEVALVGVALGWDLAQRYDHSTALCLLLERLNSTQSIPDALSINFKSKRELKVLSAAHIAFTEQKAMLRFLYSLYTLKYASSSDSQQHFKPNEHILTKYADDLRRTKEHGAGHEKYEMGWFFASPADDKQPKRHLSGSLTQLSINDTTSDTIWSHLFSSEARNDETSKSVLNHPVFSSLSIAPNATPSFNTPQMSIDTKKLEADPTQRHRLEQSGSLFGALRFAHPSLVNRSTLPLEPLNSSDSNFDMPRMRIDIGDDRTGRLELPPLEKESKSELAPWLALQYWKPKNIIPSDESDPFSSLITESSASEMSKSAKLFKFGDIGSQSIRTDPFEGEKSTTPGDSTFTFLDADQVVTKKVRVHEFLERTWHGAAGALAPWQRQEIPGCIPVEEDALEWKDRLLNRARLLNAVSELIYANLAEYQEHIHSLFPHSIQSANAFVGAVRRFINFWRRELLFGNQKAQNKKSLQEKRKSPDSKPPRSTLDFIIPPLDPMISRQSEHRVENSTSVDNEQEAEEKEKIKDFFQSFNRIVSTSGSCTQILHLMQLVQSALGSSNQSLTRFPIGAEVVNRLIVICINTEQDPSITRGITRQILSLSIVPMAKYLSEWLFWGALPSEDGIDDFCISLKKKVKPTVNLTPNQTENNNLSDTSSLPPQNEPKAEDKISSSSSNSVNTSITEADRSDDWLSDFEIKKSHVPSFLNDDNNIDILLKTGVLVRIYAELNRIKPSKAFSGSEGGEPIDKSSSPILRPIWSLYELFIYHNDIRRYIGANEEADESLDSQWEEVRAMKKKGFDSIVSVEQSLKDSFVKPIQMQFNTISPLVCRRMVDDWNLIGVIERLKNDFFGNLVSVAFEALPLGVELLDGSSSSHSLDRLRIIFAENIQGSLEKLGYRLALEKIPKCKGYDILDNIAIEPTFIKWPLSIIITQSHIDEYNKVFVLLTKMIRTKNALNSVWTNLSHATRLAHREQSTYLRNLKQRNKTEDSIFEIDFEAIFRVQHKASIFGFELQHFWTQFFNFIVRQVAHTCFHKVAKDIKKAYHFEELVNTHRNYIRDISKSALVDENSRPLMLVIEKTFHIVHKFRQQIRYSLADPSKWEIRARKAPLSVLDASVSIDQSIFGTGPPISSRSSTPASASSTSNDNDINTSVFEQANYQPDDLDALVKSSRAEFEKTMKFLLAILLKLLARGYQPHMAALVAAINWNKYYHEGPELMAQGQN